MRAVVHALFVATYYSGHQTILKELVVVSRHVSFETSPLADRTAPAKDGSDSHATSHGKAVSGRRQSSNAPFTRDFLFLPTGGTN